MSIIILLQNPDGFSWVTFWSVVIWLVYMLIAGERSAKKKRKQDEAYAERKGISYDRLLELRANTAARKLNRTTKEMVFRKYDYQCNYCGDTEDLHIDHIFPFSKYRDNSFSNLQILCRDCNLFKSDKEPDPKYHPELFGENAKYSMVEDNINVDGVNIEIKKQKGLHLTKEQIKVMEDFVEQVKQNQAKK